MAPRHPTAQQQEESTQLYNDINAAVVKLMGPQARIQNHRPFPTALLTMLRPNSFYSFIIPPIGLAVQNEAGKNRWYLTTTLKDGESCFVLCTPQICNYEFTYETDPIKYAAVHILTLNTEISFPIPWRANRELTLIVKPATDYSIATIPKDAKIEDEDFDIYVISKVKSLNTKETLQVGLRNRVLIDVLANEMSGKFECHRIRITVSNNERLAPVLSPDLGAPVPAFPPPMQGMQGIPPTATVTSQTQHPAPYFAPPQQPFGQHGQYHAPPAWPMQGTPQGPPPSTYGRGLQQQFYSAPHSGPLPAYPPQTATLTSQMQQPYPYMVPSQQPFGQQPPYVPPPAWSMPGTSQGPPPSTSGRGLQQQFYSAPSAAIGSNLSQASGAPVPPLYPPAGRGGPPPAAQQEDQEPTGAPSMSDWLKYSMGVDDEDDGGENY